MTTVVFVHGFLSNPEVWDSFISRLKGDERFREGFEFVRFQYETKLFELNLAKRIPSISDCASSLGGYLDRECSRARTLMLVGHSMGGLVIQAFLAQRLEKKRGRELARIRAVILFATPNRGSTILSGTRRLLAFFRDNPQEQDLQVLNTEVDRISEVMQRSVLGAARVQEDECPIAFQAFWGASDNVVLPPSARGPFLEAVALPGDHSGVIQCDPAAPDDQRYGALREALLHPVGHPAIYEIDAFHVILAISPNELKRPIRLRDLDEPIEIYTDNVATRVLEIAFSDKNRCLIPYEQMYRSDDGYVETISLSPENEASPETVSEYRATGKKFSYVFTPRAAETATSKMLIYNGYGVGQRKWHNHMKPNARYKLFRFTLDLTAYRRAGYEVSSDAALYFYTENVMDHRLCALRNLGTPEKPLASDDPCVWTWELSEISGGVVDVIWDVKAREDVSSA